MAIIAPLTTFSRLSQSATSESLNSLTGQIKQQPGPQAVLRRQAQRTNIRVQRGQKIVTIRERQQREHRGKERCASLAEPLDNRVKGKMTINANTNHGWTR